MKRRAFTLVELLVTIAIIGLLSTIAVVALKQSGANSRNAKRKADLIQLAKVLELYYADNGAYPSTSSQWWGPTTDYGNHPEVDNQAGCGAGVSCQAWIPGITAGGYIGRLPRDPNTNKVNPSSAYALCNTSAGNNGYFYFSNGINYKLLSHCAPEGTMSASDYFYDSQRPVHAWRVSDNPAVTRTW